MRTFYDDLFKISERPYVIDQKGKYELKKINERNNPLRMVSKTTRDGLFEHDEIRRRAWEYRTYRIRDIQGIDFVDWMKLPLSVMEGILIDIRYEEAERTAKRPPPPPGVVDGPVDPAETLIRGSSAL